MEPVLVVIFDIELSKSGACISC